MLYFFFASIMYEPHCNWKVLGIAAIYAGFGIILDCNLTQQEHGTSLLNGVARVGFGGVVDDIGIDALWAGASAGGTIPSLVHIGGRVYLCTLAGVYGNLVAVDIMALDVEAVVDVLSRSKDVGSKQAVAEHVEGQVCGIGTLAVVDIEA